MKTLYRSQYLQMGCGESLSALRREDASQTFSQKPDNLSPSTDKSNPKGVKAQ